MTVVLPQPGAPVSKMWLIRARGIRISSPGWPRDLLQYRDFALGEGNAY
jgi:hypothetical protein